MVRPLILLAALLIASPALAKDVVPSSSVAPGAPGKPGDPDTPPVPGEVKSVKFLSKHNSPVKTKDSGRVTASSYTVRLRFRVTVQVREPIDVFITHEDFPDRVKFPMSKGTHAVEVSFSEEFPKTEEWKHLWGSARKAKENGVVVHFGDEEERSPEKDAQAADAKVTLNFRLQELRDLGEQWNAAVSRANSALAAAQRTEALLSSKPYNYDEYGRMYDGPARAVRRGYAVAKTRERSIGPIVRKYARKVLQVRSAILRLQACSGEKAIPEALEDLMTTYEKIMGKPWKKD